MKCFHEQFEEFHSKFSSERSLIVALSSIKSKTTKQLNEEYSNYINSQALLSRLHYISHAFRDFTLDYLQYPLKGIKPVSVSAAMKLFKKTNDKDRYSFVIFFLKERPTVLAQIVYFSLLTPFNDSLSSALKSIKPFTEDDLMYFCFSTFPAMYNYFSTQYDQISGISFITSIFNLHLSLHGPNFGKSHKFLSYLVSSFFLSTNPGMFFEVSLKPLLRKYNQEISSIKYTYKKNGNLLLRMDYWEYCLIFAFNLLEEMCKNIPLLPTAARYLITEISKIKTEGFPFSEFFIFESMFCNYLENMLLSNNVTILRDICNIFRYHYPYGIVKTSAHTILKIITQKKDFFSMLALPSRIEKFKLSKPIIPENDPMTKAISHCEKYALFTTRDFYLIRNSIGIFLEFSDESKVSELLNAYNSLNEPNLIDENQFFKIDPWDNGSAKSKGGNPSEKIDLNATKAFDEVVDSLSTISCQKMQFKTVNELSSQTLTYCSTMLTNMQKIRIANMASDFKEKGEGMKNALSLVQTNKNALTKTSDDLFSSIFMLNSETKRNDDQILNLLSLLIKWKILPLMNELFPFDFNFNSRDIFAAADSKNSLSPVFKAIEIHINPLQLPKKHDELIKKSLIMMYLDQIDRMYDYQKHSVTAILTSMMRRYVQNMPDKIFKSGKLSKNIAQKAIDLFKAINSSSPPSSNIHYVLCAMDLLKNFSNNDICDLILRPQNSSVFGFYNFLRTYVNDKKLQSLIFTDQECLYIQRFIVICIEIRTRVLV
ncbi:hypothetical protein M9Y10_021161 [Tritrichomonas musculus]|uniref:Uncharacterized protein n=1 Tax=Tritrichomonas musculus TaxID=1915356 RepID=A0ABR2HD55_9EUKA